MSTTGKMYNQNIVVDFKNDTVDIAKHDLSAKGLKLGGTLVTASAAEINSLDGVTASATEINYTDVTTIGVAQASKALILDSSKGIATITSATITTMTGNVTGNLTGYRVGATSASQSTISAAAGASNVSTVTVQLKDGAGTSYG